MSSAPPIADRAPVHGESRRIGVPRLPRAAFITGSVAVHLVAVAAAAGIDAIPTVSSSENSSTVDFTVAAIEPPPEPPAPLEVEPAPAAPARSARVRPVRSTPTVATPEEPALVEEEIPTTPTAVEPAPHVLAANPFGSSAGVVVTGQARAKSGVGGDPNGSLHGVGDSNGTGDALRAWVMRVRRAVAARALRDYPRAARRAGLQGNVRVSMSVDARGDIASVRVTRSSGHERLDRAAVASVETVGHLPPPPASFSRQGRPLVVPIAYRLR